MLASGSTDAAFGPPSGPAVHGGVLSSWRFSQSSVTVAVGVTRSGGLALARSNLAASRERRQPESLGLFVVWP